MASVVLGTPGAEIAAPAITASGGFDGWPVGDLAPNTDLVIALAP